MFERYKTKLLARKARMCGGLHHIVWGISGFVCASVMACLFHGCNTDGCTDNRSALPLMAFYSSSTDAPMVLESIGVGGVDAPADSLLVYPGQSAMSTYLPFRFEKNSTSFFLHYAYPQQGLDDPRFNDTITFHYTSSPYFASEECGAYYIYTIKKVNYTRHLIASVAVTDSAITNVEMERIRVYFRTSEADASAIGKEGDRP